MNAVTELVEQETTTLLGPDDPAPFHVENARGKAPVLLVCDHAYNRIPKALGTLGLGTDELQKHIAWDPGTVALTRHMAAALDAPAVFSAYSRLVIDINRDHSHPTSIAPVSDGVTVPGNIGLSEDDIRQRQDEIFWPYQNKVVAMLDDFQQRGIDPVVISVHSFTEEMTGQDRPWHIGVLWNNDPRVPVPLLDNLKKQNPDLVFGDNLPYSGRDSWGYTIEYNVTPRGLPTALFEFRQDLVSDPENTAEWAAIALNALKPILADEGLYKARHYDADHNETDIPVTP